MRVPSLGVFGVVVLGLALAGPAGCGAAPRAGGPAVQPSAPLVLDHAETFTIDSRVLGETRRINVLVPTEYGKPFDRPLPVLYMMDGGLSEDFLHIAGLVQVLSSNGSIRPHLLVGVENTQRRRDMTGPTSVASDRQIAPEVGGSAAFRRFIREELMPAVAARYAVTGESAAVGESLAGLFVLEAAFRDPDLFNTVIAVDPSLWWDGGSLVRLAASAPNGPASPRVYAAASGEPSMRDLHAALARVMAEKPGAWFEQAILPEETHATVFHPAALTAFRAVLGLTPDGSTAE